ncbi:uncharacterized protein AB9W97_013673 [Spinachia spinachia]
MLVLIQSSDAGAVGAPCKLKTLAAVTVKLVEGSLKCFDKANGEHVGTWIPGFPQLKAAPTPPLNGSRVHCSLLFMATGLQDVLDDQRNDLNPNDASLHEELARAVSSVNLLAACVELVLGGQCSQKLPPPTMPEYAYEKKQWSHTLLDTSRVYLHWLGRNVEYQRERLRKAKL